MAKALIEFEKLQHLLAVTAALVSKADSDTPVPASDFAECKAALDAIKGLPQLSTLVSRPKVGVGVILVSRLHPKQVLVGERKGSHGSGKFALPGGHLEGGESWGLCAEREVDEELGIHVVEDRYSYVATTNDIMPDEKLHYITLFLVAHLKDDEVPHIVNKEPDKCVGWRWVTADELAGLPMFIPLGNLIKMGALHSLLEAE